MNSYFIQELQRLQTRALPASIAASTVPDRILFERDRLEQFTLRCQTSPFLTQYTTFSCSSAAAVVSGTAEVSGTIDVSGTAEVSGTGIVSGTTVVSGMAIVSEPPSSRG